ncbi:MAG: neutral/alkaline non-lysosomal ceramidase N-terminal domain-containing protein [Acidobacteria bacterium]|nr:neutral/alkaline non-lysosomal ceramidase N-terminal domain-containing protein [Acidobacteriota bacterium]
MKSSFALLFLCVAAATASDYRTGIASLVITPEGPIRLSGYASRKHPSDGVVQDLKARALVIEDKQGHRAAIVTTDVIGLPRSITDVVSARVQKDYGLDRSGLVINSIHTHTGPVIANNLDIMFDLTPEERAAIQRYSSKLTDDLVMLVGMAIQNLAPAQLAFASGEANFAVNRREPGPKGIKIGVNPAGPTDPEVPVLRVSAPDGSLRAILFGYACHNTTLTGDFYKISGDYAGFAEAGIEKAHPGAVAMFMELCGADQNPNPRGTLELAERHGRDLAAEVMRVASGNMRRVEGPVRGAFQIVDLPFAYHTRDMFEARLHDKDPIRVRHAQAMLRTYDERCPIRSYPYPVQAIQFGKEVTLLALGGEVVVDYCLRARQEFGSKGLIVAGYSNDVMSYIPSLRVLKEGGYEASDSMIYYGLPGPYSEEVEDRIFGSIRQVMKRVGRKPVKPSAPSLPPAR